MGKGEYAQKGDQSLPTENRQIQFQKKKEDQQIRETDGFNVWSHEKAKAENKKYYCRPTYSLVLQKKAAMTDRVVEVVEEDADEVEVEVIALEVVDIRDAEEEGDTGDAEEEDMVV